MLEVHGTKRSGLKAWYKNELIMLCMKLNVLGFSSCSSAVIDSIGEFLPSAKI